jgi:hypothetical protein
LRNEGKETKEQWKEQWPEWLVKRIVQLDGNNTRIEDKRIQEQTTREEKKRTKEEQNKRR